MRVCRSTRSGARGSTTPVATTTRRRHGGLGGGVVCHRFPAGDRAVVRFDARYDHFFDGGEGYDDTYDVIVNSKVDVFSLAVSIGVRL